MKITLRRGLDLPLAGKPRQEIQRASAPRSVALLERDLPPGRYALRVSVGQRVAEGQPLFVDRSRPEILFTSPAAGVVGSAQPSEGDERLAVRVDLDVDTPEKTDLPSEALPPQLAARAIDEVHRLERGEVTRRLLAAGEWPALRVRPFGHIPDPDSVPDALFVRAMDTNPLTAQAHVVLAGRTDDLRLGLAALSRLLDGPIFACCDADLELPVGDLERVRVVQFAGPHPAGLIGTHVHHLFPIRDGRQIWSIGYQDVLAIGHLFRTGRNDLERVVALAGPLVLEPRLLRARVGSNTEDLVRGQLLAGECRIVSGSVLTGRRAASAESFLGRGHEQIVVLPEVRERAPRSWRVPGLLGARRVPPWRRATRVTTDLHGTPRAMLPLAIFENVVPLRLPTALLLRALAAGDVESARAFGALELDEEDLALCSYLCPAKLEYGGLLRSALERIGASPA